MGAPELNVDLARMRAIRVHGSFDHINARWWQIPVLLSLSSRTTAGICLGDDIYVGESPLLNRWPLLVHELTHWAQYCRSGTVRFLAGYVGEFAWRLPRSPGANAAYLALSYEVEARRVEACSSQSVPDFPWLLPEPTRSLA